MLLLHEMKVSLRRCCRTLVKAIGVVTAFYCLLLVISSNTGTTTLQLQSAAESPAAPPQHNGITSPVQQQAVGPSSHQQQPYSSFIEALAARADSDGYILLAMIDETFTDMALNFYEASLHAHSVNNFLFVGVGRNACQILQNNVQSIACFYYAEDPSAGRASSYGQREFKRKMNIRTDMILEALAANFTVIHSDTDMAFLSNPFNHVKELIKSTDVAPMWDTVCYNAGFIMLRPTPLAQQLYLILRNMTSTTRLDDQQALNRALKRLKAQNPTFSMKVLNKHSFVSGRAYFEVGGRLLPKPNNCDPSKTANCPIVVHNNWIVSKSAKIYRFREHLMWLYDGDNRYYSNATRSYLTYRNSNDTSVSTESQIAALKTALAFGHLLRRVVILPTFICSNGARRCPLNSLIRIRLLDTSFKDRFRESSFLRHPKVPDAVKRSQYDGAAALRRASTVSKASNNTRLTISSRRLLQLFAKVSSSVLNVGSLVGLQVVFDDKSDGYMLEQKLQKSIRRASYRQY